MSGEAIHSSDYLGVGKTTASEVAVIEFKYTDISDAFLNRNGRTVAALKTLDAASRALLPADRAVVFTNNHDTQRASAIDYQDAPYHDLASVFMLAAIKGVEGANKYGPDPLLRAAKAPTPRAGLN